MKSTDKYVYEVNLNEQNSASFILDLVGKNKRVMEVGAGPGSITKLLVANSGCQVSAIEIDDESINSLKKYCDSVYKIDLNSQNWIDQFSLSDKFDVVVAADVLEHLNNPLLVLNSFKKLIKSDGSVIVSLPHVGHSVIYACLMDNDFEYRDWGLLDKTHIRFFGIKNMQRLFDDAGMKIIDVKFVLRKPEYTEYAERWAKTSSELRCFIQKNKFCDVYQVVIKAVPIEAEGISVDLITRSVGKTPFSVIREINQLILLYTPKFFYLTVRNVYRKFFM